MKTFLSICIVFCMLCISIFSIEIEPENLWSKYSLFKEGIVIIENKLYVNAFTSVEIYLIQANGNLEYDGIIENNKLIKNIQFDANDNMLYVHASSCISNGPDWINAYQIIDGIPDFFFSTEELPDYWLYKDFIYSTNNYVILIQPDTSPCYNKLTGEFEVITYPYIDIVGSYDDILIDYDVDNTILYFYKVENINQPILLFQYNYSIEEPYRTLARCFDDIHFLLVDKSHVLVFNIENEQNISYDITWQFNFTISDEILKEPVGLDNNQIYFGSKFGDNFIYDVTDYNSPILVNSWYEEDYEAFSYCIYESSWLYRTMDLYGIRKFDLNNMPTTQYEEYGYAFPLCSTEYFNGIIYKNDFDNLYRVDTDNLEEEIICEIPFSIGWNYYLHENLLLIEGGNLINHNLAIINLDQNQLMNYINPNMTLHIIQNGRLFYQNGNNIEVYQVDQNYELEFLLSFDTGLNAYLTKYDNEKIWVSCTNQDFIFNTITMQIDHDFDDFFASCSSGLITPVKYDNRLIVSDYSNETKLYDISNLSNPILLELKAEEHLYNYFVLDDFIIESYLSENVKIYNKFDDTFTNPIQEYDFETIVFDLKIDEERNRILASSWYFHKSYLYEITGNGVEIVPEIQSNRLSNYPNPFNPSTTIILELSETGNTELAIYNIRGQKITTLIQNNLTKGTHSIIWNGEDELGKIVSSGQYLVKLKQNRKETATKIMLLK